MVELLEQSYQLIRNDENCFDIALVEAKVTEYFLPFDYICGDFAYDKLRLKGFYDSTNTKVTAINDIASLDDYIRDYCAYGAKLFLLKKEK